ncbi:MAG: hypothetical protein JWM74_2249 [Myxococcaceae bacterium]|nr:hypothetical protein [Myxococcaceae bacterium]
MTEPSFEAVAALAAAPGPLEGLVMDLEAALRADVGVPEAIAFFGLVASSRRDASSPYAGLHLTPRHAGVHAVTLETKDEALIGVVVEYDPPVLVDVVALGERWGAASEGPAAPGGHAPGPDIFNLDTADFRAQLMLDRRVWGEPRTARQIHRIILRRTPMIEILPDAFRSQGDLVRLLVLALTPVAPAPVGFYGTIGVAQRGQGTRTHFAPPVYSGGTFVPTNRNVTRAWIDHIAVDGRDRVRAMRVEIEEPIRAEPALLATMLSKRLATEVSTTVEPGGLRLHVAHPRASVMIEATAGTVTAIELTRA